jgi:hypothetical protein
VTWHVASWCDDDAVVALAGVEDRGSRTVREVAAGHDGVDPKVSEVVVRRGAVEGAPPWLPHHDLVLPDLQQPAREKGVAVELDVKTGQ